MNTIKQDMVKFNFAESELASRIEGLPQRGQHRMKFTDEQDAILLRYWNSGRNKREIADAIGICYDVCLRRYKELTSGGDK
jgi:hypothetical protein